MKKNNLHFLEIILVFLSILVITSCTKKNAVQELKLKNGIPIFFDYSKDKNVDAIYIIVKGGAMCFTPEKSGIEDATFSMMCYGSEKYDYKTIQSLSYKTRSSISSFSMYTGSALSLSCIDYYLDEMLPVFLDSFMNPQFSSSDYDRLMTEYGQSLQSEMNNPESLIYNTIKKDIYKNHPLESFSNVTSDSIHNLSLENIQSYYKELLDASRISVIAVGKMKKSKLLASFNKTLGKLDSSRKSFSIDSLPPISVNGEPLILTSPFAERTGFMYRVFSSPPVTSKDYVASCLASEMYSKTLFNVVREKHGACYTPSSFVMSSHAAFGADCFYRVSNPSEIVGFVKEAEMYMADGKLITSLNDDGEYVFENIEDGLEGYINSYVNQRYNAWQTSMGIANKYTGGLMQFDNIYKVDDLVSEAKKTTAEDIRRVYKKYWINNPSRWYALVGPENKDNVKFE